MSRRAQPRNLGLGTVVSKNENEGVMYKTKWFIKKGRIHGRTVADGWVGAVMLKPLAIPKYSGRMDGWMDGPTGQGVESRVRD